MNVETDCFTLGLSGFSKKHGFSNYIGESEEFFFPELTFYKRDEFAQISRLVNIYSIFQMTLSSYLTCIIGTLGL